jgi:hypothetical protein
LPDFVGIIVGFQPVMNRLLTILLFSVLISTTTLVAQDPWLPDSLTVVYARVDGGDTLIIVDLPEVSVFAFLWPENPRELRRLNRTISHVKKVYPYAKLAGIKLREYESILMAAETDRERRQIMKQAEQEISEQFGPDLRNLTFTQGKILLKLIDRETGETSYELVRELRGSFTAFFYQTFARIWGFNLKDRYDPDGEDKLIEQIVQLIERGQI